MKNLYLKLIIINYLYQIKKKDPDQDRLPYKYKYVPPSYLNKPKTPLYSNDRIRDPVKQGYKQEIYDNYKYGNYKYSVFDRVKGERKDKNLFDYGFNNSYRTEYNRKY